MGSLNECKKFRIIMPGFFCKYLEILIDIVKIKMNSFASKTHIETTSIVSESLNSDVAGMIMNFAKSANDFKEDFTDDEMKILNNKAYKMYKFSYRSGLGTDAVTVGELLKNKGYIFTRFATQYHDLIGARKIASVCWFEYHSPAEYDDEKDYSFHDYNALLTFHIPMNKNITLEEILKAFRKKTSYADYKYFALSSVRETIVWEHNDNNEYEIIYNTTVYSKSGMTDDQIKKHLETNRDAIVKDSPIHKGVFVITLTTEPESYEETNDKIAVKSLNFLCQLVINEFSNWVKSTYISTKDDRLLQEKISFSNDEDDEDDKSFEYFMMRRYLENDLML